MRLLEVDDIDDYYRYGFVESSDEAKYYTGTIDEYSKEQVLSYLKKIVNDNTRYDFIICKDDEIVGEVVINNIKNKNCHYRICIFNKKNFSKRIGYNATF